MGLAVVELIMEIEDEFDIKIQDNDYSRCQTVGHLAELIQEMLRIPIHAFCTSPHVFCQLRKALMDQLDVPRDAVRLNSRLDDLIPRETRRIKWHALQERLGWHLPALVVYGDDAQRVSGAGDVCFIAALVLTICSLFLPVLMIPVGILVLLSILSKVEFVCVPLCNACPGFLFHHQGNGPHSAGVEFHPSTGTTGNTVTRRDLLQSPSDRLGSVEHTCA